MSENETSDYHESILKNFKLPGKVPIEDLMSKYSGVLEITFGVMNGIIDKHLQKAANGKYNHYDDDDDEKEQGDEEEQDEEDGNDLSALDTPNGRSPRREITNGRNKTNNKNDKNNNDGDDEFRGNNRNIDEQSDCVIISSSVSVFKTPARNSKRSSRSLIADKTPNASTTSKAKPKTTASTTTTTTSTSTTTNTASRTGKRKREASEEPGEAKPGTLGSRQTLPTQSRESKLNRFTVQCNDLIDTKNLVTSDMMVSLQELCQRAKIKKVPDDPTDLLMKFSIIIPRLSEMDAYIEK